MKITRCLMISASHISKDTYEKLIDDKYKLDEMWPWVDTIEDDRGLILSIYDDDIKEIIEEDDRSIPDDLWGCMLLAYENNCEMLLLEFCGDEVEGLPVYDW